MEIAAKQAVKRLNSVSAYMESKKVVEQGTEIAAKQAVKRLNSVSAKNAPYMESKKAR